jgi:hypothetical protein
MGTEWGQQEVRGTFYDKVVKQIAAQTYKFKQAVSVVPTSAWKNFFFREDTTVLTGQTGNAIGGIPRGAEFPQASANWTLIQSTIKKYGLEENIPYEDLISDEIDVRDRTLIKIAAGVAKAVDDEIWDTLTENRVPVAIQSITLGLNYEWDSSSAAIIDDLLQAKQLISEQNYDTEDLMAFVSPKDYRRIMNYLAEKGAQFPSVAAGVATNGVQGSVAGITLVTSNSVTASWALVVVPKRCGNWKELVALQTTTKEDPYKSLTIRAVEMGVTQLTDPKAVVLIKNTQAA